MSPISVVIPTFQRSAQLAFTLRRILDCRPLPAEIIVHIDAGDSDTESTVRRAFPEVRVLKSEIRMGPGGGRNKLIAAAISDIVASFDDDSYPLDADYFLRLSELFASRPDAAIVASQIVHRGETAPEAKAVVGRAVQFVGCGVAYRREVFLSSGGYIPLAVAYGMEEVDLCIRLTSRGKQIYFTPWLRVFHDTDLSHHNGAVITASSISNQALLVYLRYPMLLWPYGMIQVMRRIAWLIWAGRFHGIASGLLSIPDHLWRYRAYRDTVSFSALTSFLRARRSLDPFEPLT